MDKVQFNNQLVSMRKTVKRAKVQLIHHLTRQAGVVRKKKGSGKQLIKNQRRAARLIDEIEIIKDLRADEVTKTAVKSKETLQDVLNKASSTAKDRAMARLINQRLVSQQVATFKDLVTDDLLAIGKKKESLLQTEMFERKKRRPKLHYDSSSHGDDEDEDDSDSDAASQNRMNYSSGSDVDEQDDHKKSSVLFKKQRKARQKTKSSFFVPGSDGELQQVSDEDMNDSGSEYSDDGDEKVEEDEDIESVEDMDDDIDDLGENFNVEFRELSAQLRKDHSGREERGSVVEKRRGKGLDSMFVGKLSGKRPVDCTGTYNKTRNKKNRPGQIERQQMNIKKQLQILRRPSNKESKSRHIPLVDVPSLTKKEKSSEKLIPGINAPYEKPKMDVATEKLPSSQRPLIQPASRRGRGRGGGAPRGRGDRQPSGRQQAAVTQKMETLHPSWEASKRRKEQESKILPFQGKKITFDD